MSLKMDKIYQHINVEDKWYKLWEENGYFSSHGKDNPISMVIPPPNVTGALHMGHALNNTIQDIIARFNRLKGCSVLWIPGTDHAGIATQNVVEKELAKQGKYREELGRKDFIRKVWEWKKEYGNRITKQLRKLGASLDWSSERFTMDQGLSEAVKENFIRLYNEKLIYRDEYIVNWCPRCHTAISDIEVEHKENSGHFWHIRYPFVHDKSAGIVVATTRPETMFGDTAIAVNPKDKRYKDLIGKFVYIPISHKKIPIIADEYVDPDFGTGALKITPAHDPNDFEVGKKHQLEIVKVLDTKACMNSNAPAEYLGMDRDECREALVVDLGKQKYLVQVDEHQHAVGHCYRCYCVVEPYVSKQWFVKMDNLVKEPIKKVQTGDIKFIPDRWKKLYFDWMENIRPWCISRQIWWGHRIPVWYCNDCGQEIVSKIDIVSCPKCNSSKIKQDEDVLDTWFSSALWPFSTLGWPEKTKKLEKFYPTTILVTGYDIITFWVSRMITMGLYNMKEIPFKNIFIHGLVRDSQGRKMSKSLGNVVDPLKLIEEKGADVLRYTLASLVTSGGQDIRLTDDRILNSRNFVNKIWNLSRYILTQKPVAFDLIETNIADQWIVAKFNQVLEEVQSYYENYDFNYTIDKLYEFVWGEFCDWYVEMTKLHKETSQKTLIIILNNILKMLHPVTPFITEEIWQSLKQHPLFPKQEKNCPSIMVTTWPTKIKKQQTNNILKKMSLAQEIIRKIRNLKADLNVPQKKGNVVLKNSPDYIKSFEKYILHLARLDKIVYSDATPKEAHSYGIVESSEIFLPLVGLIDLEKEKQRLNKELDDINKQIKRIENKLNNPQFIAKAPEKIINKEQDSLADLKFKITAVQKKISFF